MSSITMMLTLKKTKVGDVTDGLQYLHSLDIIHGDLKAVRPCVVVVISITR